MSGEPRAPEDQACAELVRLTTEYLEEALRAEDRALFEAHLAICPGCDAYLAQMRATIRATGALREADVPPEGKARLLAAFRGWKGRRGSGPPPGNAPP